jgi:AcrR family transcriptional regulator
VSRDTSWYGRLDRPLIVDAALRIAARPGAQEVGFRALGNELGADPTAVYRHFRNKAQLMSALIDRLMDDVAQSLPVGADWRDVLHAMASSTLDTFVAHPAIGARLADSRPVGPGELALVEVSMRAFQEAGLAGDVLVKYYGAFSGMLLSFVAMACRELVTAHDESASGIESFPWLPADVEISPERFPMLSEHAAELVALDYRSTYFAGVEVLISAVEALASTEKP